MVYITSLYTAVALLTFSGVVDPEVVLKLFAASVGAVLNLISWVVV